MIREPEHAPAPPQGTLSEEQCARLRERLRRAVRRVCPRWLADHSEDLVQVALMRVLAIHAKSEGKRQLSSSYLHKVAYSALVDEIRRLRRRQEVPLDNEGFEDKSAATSLPDPEHTSAGREIARSIGQCLSLLIRPRRLAVTLHLQGHGVPDVARLLSWSRKRAENLVYRGLADLRDCLEAKGLRP